VPTWTGRAEVEAATADWVAWYNHDRLHSSIGYLPPVEFEQSHTSTSDKHLKPEAA